MCPIALGFLDIGCRYVDRMANIFSISSGRRYPGSTGSMDPEDYAERGGLWEALDRSRVSFYNFGEANETAYNREDWVETATGSGHSVMVPMQKALWPEDQSHNIAGFNTNISDKFRVQQFETEFTKMWLTGKSKMPSIITIQLPNDHTAKPRHADGYPFFIPMWRTMITGPLGRILLQFLSHTPFARKKYACDHYRRRPAGWRGPLGCASQCAHAAGRPLFETWFYFPSACQLRIHLQNDL